MRLDLYIRGGVPSVLLAGWVLAAVGCASQATPQSPPPAAPAAAPGTVRAVHPERRSLERVVEQPGMIYPHEETRLYARVTGDAGQPRKDIGALVKAGEILVELNVPDLEDDLRQKEALVRQAEAELGQAKKAQAAAAANVEAIEATVAEATAGVSRAQAMCDRWELEATRISGLVKRGTLDVQTHDETQNQLRAARAGCEEARARVLSTRAAVRKAQADAARAEADVLAAAARVDVARAEMDRVNTSLGFAKVCAPFDGVITHRRVNTGDLVHPNGSREEYLFVVARLSPVRVVIAVPEADAALVNEKSQVELRVPALGGQPLTRTVTRSSWALDPGARTLRAEIDVPNKDGKLRPGMYVYAHITGQTPQTWVLPTAAVVTQGETKVCFLVEEGKALRTPVRIGRSDGKYVEVLQRQLPGAGGAWSSWTGKENVAVPGAELKDGQKVSLAASAQ